MRTSHTPNVATRHGGLISHDDSEFRGRASRLTLRAALIGRLVPMGVHA